VAQLGDLDRESEQLLFHVVRAVADATHAGDPYMTGHSSRVAAYCDKIAEAMELPSRDRLMLFIAAAFHDVGYLSTPEYILRKPSVLAEDEMEEVRVHPVRGAEVFSAQPSLSEIARAVRHHHERYDGSGYPEGLRGDEIPLFSRIILVAESYVSLHVRPDVEDPLSELRTESGTMFDPRVLAVLESVLGANGAGAAQTCGD